MTSVNTAAGNSSAAIHGVNSEVLSKIDQVLRKVDPNHHEPFLTFILDGILSEDLREYLDTDSNAREAVDDALNLLSESLIDVQESLEKSESKMLIGTDVDSAGISKLVDTFLSWFNSVGSRSTKERAAVYQNIAADLNTRSDLNRLPSDLTTVVEDTKDWSNQARKVAGG